MAPGPIASRIVSDRVIRVVAEAHPVALRIPHVERPAGAVRDLDAVGREVCDHLLPVAGADPERDEVPPGGLLIPPSGPGRLGHLLLPGLERLQRQEASVPHREPHAPQGAVFAVMSLLLREAEDIPIERDGLLHVVKFYREMVDAEGLHGGGCYAPGRSMARLLIIEDGVALASLLVSATSERGHLTSAYHAGAPGLQAASEERFDLAIVDLLLPDVRGAEVLERLRELGVPTIAMSGVFKGERFARDAVERHGARAFFEKPFELERLLDTIEAEVLRGQAQQGEAAAPDGSGNLNGGSGEDDPDAIEIDFDLEVDVPTAEIHLDHPTTELELNPEALEAFQEALQHSAAPSSVGASFKPPVGDALEEADHLREQEQRPPGIAEEDAETSFAGILDDAPVEPPAAAGSPVNGRTLAAPFHASVGVQEEADPNAALPDEGVGSPDAPSAVTPPDDEEVTAPTPATREGEVAPGAASATDEEITAPTPSTSPTAAERTAAATDDEVTAPTPLEPAEGAEADHGASHGETAASAWTSSENTEGASGARPEDLAGHPAPQDPVQAEADAGADGIPPDVSELVDLSLDRATWPSSQGAPHTPFSERGAVWEGEAASIASRRRPAPPPEASLGDHGLFGLLNACHQSRFTGTLHVEGEGQRVLTLIDGHLLSIRDPADASPLPSIAALSVLDGRLEEELLEEVRELAGHEGLSEDEAVLLMGLMTPEQLSERGRLRLRPLLAELLDWTEGRLRLSAGARDVDAPQALRIPLAGLIFEAIFERGETDAMRGELTDDLRPAPTEDPPYDLGEIPMSGAQAQLLAHSDGSKSLADLTLLSDLEATEVRLTLWALIRLGILAPMHPTRSTRRITFGL